MSKRTLFQKPYGVTCGNRSFYRAMVNGQWIDGTYAEVDKKHREEKRKHQKNQREIKKALQMKGQ